MTSRKLILLDVRQYRFFLVFRFGRHVFSFSLSFSLFVSSRLSVFTLSPLWPTVKEKHHEKNTTTNTDASHKITTENRCVLVIKQHARPTRKDIEHEYSQRNQPQYQHTNIRAKHGQTWKIRTTNSRTTSKRLQTTPTETRRHSIAHK